jgi:hypothetical protein
VAVHFHRHRVDEERHVVVDDLDDRVRRLPAMLFDRRIERAHLCLAALAFAGEVPMGERGAVQVDQLPLGEVVGIDLPIVVAHERRQCLALLGRHLGVHQRNKFVQPLGTPVVLNRVGFHVFSSLARWRGFIGPSQPIVLLWRYYVVIR